MFNSPNMHNLWDHQNPFLGCVPEWWRTFLANRRHSGGSPNRIRIAAKNKKDYWYLLKMIDRMKTNMDSSFDTALR